MRKTFSNPPATIAIVLSTFILSSCATFPTFGSVSGRQTKEQAEGNPRTTVPTATPAMVAAPTAPSSANVTTTESAPSIPVATTASSSLESESLMAKASIAIESNHLTEAILSYISVIAIYEESLSPASKEFADSAATELARIGRSLTIEPGSEWIDAKGGQIAASSRSVGKEGALSPSVYLYENYGSGKSPVADASIYFEFTKNSGSIISLVNTDVYGKANTNISRLDNPGKEAMIRAYPRFQARGKVFSFKSVAREFSYLPPTNVARIMVLETSEFGASDNPQTVDAIVGTLKPIGLQFVPFNGKLAMEDFKKAFGGDHAILAALGVDASAPYTVFALVEAAAARQMELDGKKYNIFTSQAQATFRLMRADGTVAFAIPINGERGQGGTPEAAAADAIKKARDALVVMMKERLGLIKDALEKE